jgi:TPP-dependent indolepyruvate ferredoxin oxidoreductase alpha subunit
VLTGHEALVRALVAARIRRAWSFPGSPLTKSEMLLDKSLALKHAFTVNEQVAASLALGGALLSNHATAVLMKHVGVNVALDTLATLGIANELRSAALVVEGVDPGPKTSQNAQDNRATLARVAHLAQLEAASPDEVYHTTRLAAQASLRTGMPIALRYGSRALDPKGDVLESPPDLPSPGIKEGGATFARGAGPWVCTAQTYRYHVEKRGRLLHHLEPLVASLSQVTGAPASSGDGNYAVIVAGHLGPKAAARAWSRRLAALRLGAAWPLPRKLLLEFLRGRHHVLVLEEGEPFLEHEIAAFCNREGISCRVHGAGGTRPAVLDDERIDALLQRFGGRVKAEADPVVRDSAGWRAPHEVVLTLAADDDGEPWPLFLARLRGEMKGFAASDPRLVLLRSLRNLDRPTMLVADPGNTGVLGIRDRLVDVKMHMGSAAPIAGALADATDLEERAGSGPPLAVALIGDTNHYHSEWNGILDNAIARREVLHVLVVNRRSEMTAGVKTPYLSDEALESSLRAAGVAVATAKLDDPGLGAAVAYAASRSGPRALICYSNAGGEDADG